MALTDLGLQRQTLQVLLGQILRPALVLTELITVRDCVKVHIFLVILREMDPVCKAEIRTMRESPLEPFSTKKALFLFLVFRKSTFKEFNKVDGLT